MEIKDIVVKKTYKKNGEDKTLWLNVGCLKTTDQGKQFIELNMFPNQSFYIFEKKEKAAPKEESVIQLEDLGGGGHF